MFRFCHLSKAGLKDWLIDGGWKRKNVKDDDKDLGESCSKDGFGEVSWEDYRGSRTGQGRPALSFGQGEFQAPFRLTSSGSAAETAGDQNSGKRLVLGLFGS